MKYALLLLVALYSHTSLANINSEGLLNLCVKLQQHAVEDSDATFITFNLAATPQQDKSYRLAFAFCNSAGGCPGQTYVASKFDSRYAGKEISRIFAGHLGCMMMSNPDVDNIKLQVFEAKSFSSDILIGESTVKVDDLIARNVDVSVGGTNISVAFADPEFAIEPGTFDQETGHSSLNSKLIVARYHGKNFLAWTGDENDARSQDELMALATERATTLCKNFGYRTGSVSPDSIKMVTSPDQKINVIRDGQITTIDSAQSTGSGLAATLTLSYSIDRGRMLTAVRCSK